MDINAEVLLFDKDQFVLNALESNVSTDIIDKVLKSIDSNDGDYEGVTNLAKVRVTAGSVIMNRGNYRVLGYENWAVKCIASLRSNKVFRISDGEKEVDLPLISNVLVRI